jgi:hypothetical protein
MGTDWSCDRTGATRSGRWLVCAEPAHGLADRSDYFLPVELRKDTAADLSGGCGTWTEPSR